MRFILPQSLNVAFHLNLRCNLAREKQIKIKRKILQRKSRFSKSFIRHHQKKNDLQELLSFLESELDAVGFYNSLADAIQRTPNSFNNKGLFLGGKAELKSDLSKTIKPTVQKGDVRIDVPVLIGDVKSKHRILVLGLEPRHTDDFFNIMKAGNKVFATPFGIDRWYSDSKQGVYASAFERFLSSDKLFLFSDFVKEYHVADPELKGTNDQLARENFKQLFEKKYRVLLEKEIKIFEPTMIVALGKVDISKKVPKSWLEKYNIQVISHPTHGNYNRMQTAMINLMK